MLHYFSEGIPFFEKYFRGWVDEKHWFYTSCWGIPWYSLQSIHFSMFQLQHISAILWIRGFTIVAKWMHAKNSLTLTDPDGVPWKKTAIVLWIGVISWEWCVFVCVCFRWPQVFPGDLLVFTGFKKFPRRKNQLDWVAEPACFHTFN